jgi:hypothetical protein
VVCGGERGIRTLETALTAYTISNRAPSATRTALQVGSTSRIRTYDPSVNSRMLYRWAMVEWKRYLITQLASAIYECSSSLSGFLAESIEDYSLMLWFCSTAELWWNENVISHSNSYLRMLVLFVGSLADYKEDHSIIHLCNTLLCRWAMMFKETAWQRPTLTGAMPQLPSALKNLTSVFGMGTGVTSLPSLPDYYNYTDIHQ